MQQSPASRLSLAGLAVEQLDVQVGVEGVGDAKKSVDPRRPPAALEASDRRLGGSYELGEIGLGEASLPPAIRDLPGDLGEQPSLLGTGEPSTNSLHGLTHISIMLYIAVVRYKRSIAAVAYLVLQALWIVSIDQSIFYGSDFGTAFIFSGIGLASLGVGLATGSWLAPGLPFLAVAMSLPFGYPSGDYHEPLPIWFSILLLAPVEAVVVVLGVTGRKLWDRWHRAAVA
jgi:hypothetical protein